MTNDNSNEISSIINDDYILSYFKKLLTSKKYNLLSSFLKDKDTLLLDETIINDDLIIECKKKNLELKPLIQLCNNEIMNSTKSSFLIRFLEWDGLLCYQDKNWLNMYDLDAKTFLIKGANGCGKSSIYDILLLAIWGKTPKMDGLSSGIINYNKTTAQTIIDIQIDGIIYKIIRTFQKDIISNKMKKNKSIIYKYINNDEIEIIGCDKLCNDTIKKLFGNMDNFLNSAMITQNNDNDILKLDYDNTIKLIDKFSNVEYIYNLQTLFNTAHNKYKDFKRTIENKKQVYEKLLSTNKIEELTEEEIQKTNYLISELQKQKEELLTKFNSIMIDIKNPKNLIILDTDYNKLLNDLGYIIDDEEYQSLLIKYNELKYLLKDVNTTTLNKFKDDYKDDYEKEYDNLIIINKPCELSILDDEEKFLKSYLINYNEIDDKDINLLLSEIKLKLNEKQLLEKDKQSLISNKPETINKPIKDEKQCITEINKYYIKIYDDSNQ